MLEAAAAAGVDFELNDGRRTEAIQRARIAKHGLWSPSNPTGAAPARQSSPHIKHGAANHALDVRWDDGGAARLAVFYRRRGVPMVFNVPAERWHVDPTSEVALIAAARRLDAPPDPFAGYPVDERRWLREYDALRAAHRDIARRIVLVRVMRDRRKSIWQAAQQSGWDKLNRRARYRSLLARTE